MEPSFSEEAARDAPLVVSPVIDQVERAEDEAARKQAIERVIQLLQQARQNYQQSQQ